MSSAAAPNQYAPAIIGSAPNPKNKRRLDLIRSFIGNHLPISHRRSSFGAAPGAVATGAARYTMKAPVMVAEMARQTNSNFPLRKCPTSWKLVDGFLSRLLPEASTSWKLVGHCAARFSFFQGAATAMKAPRKILGIIMNGTYRT